MKRKVGFKAKLTTVVIHGEPADADGFHGYVDEVETIPYTAEQQDQRGKPMSLPVTWQSSVPTVASIDSVSGLPTDRSEGDTEITALIDNQVWTGTP